MTPKASFVIPAFNAQAYLAETIESCLSQTQKKIEIIVVDDGSTDATKSLIIHYQTKDSRVQGVFLPKNVGRSEARNAGCREASSDILMMLDSDDIAAPGRTADTLAAFKKFPKAGIVYGKFQVIDALGKIHGLMEAPPFDYERVKKDGFTYIGHSTMAFKKSVFKKVQYTGGDIAKHGIDDWWFQVNAHKAGVKFAPVNKVLAQYRFVAKARDEAKILELKKECLAA